MDSTVMGGWMDVAENSPRLVRPHVRFGTTVTGFRESGQRIGLRQRSRWEREYPR